MAGFQHTAARRRLSPTVTADDTTDSFNTQPPEGGWPNDFSQCHAYLFQHTAARRRLISEPTDTVLPSMFQHTAARRRLAGLLDSAICKLVSTHSRPKAAGELKTPISTTRLFQHTAARRRLLIYHCFVFSNFRVSTHSRPKAAGFRLAL